MSTVKVIATIPLYAPAIDQSYLTGASFGRRHGSAPACFDGWRRNPYTFKHDADWRIEDGALIVEHEIDLAQPEERRLYDAIQDAKHTRYYMSWGSHAAPLPPGTRPRRHMGRGAPHPVSGAQLRHIAYVANYARYAGQRRARLSKT